MRKTYHLNEGWTFIPEFKQAFINQKTIEGAQNVMIPHTIKELPFNYFNDEDYQFVGTYTKILNLTDTLLEAALILHFGGCMTITKIYLNGQLLMIHEGGYTPFDVDISSHVHAGENILNVIVDASEVKNVPPFGHLVDYLAFGGIYREVALLVCPKRHIEQLHVMTTEPQNLQEDAMVMDLYVRLNESSDRDLTVAVKLLLQDQVVHEHQFKETFNFEGHFASLVKQIARWTVDEPVLYILELTLLDADEIIDQQQTRFGFRTCHFTPEGFLLNNQLVKLIGLNRHQSYPYVGYAMPKRMQEKDAELLKAFGCNIVRTSHYMQSDHFINRCDEIGLLVLEEIPGWQYIGDEHFKALTYQHLETMIHHHFNHPSIVTWGVRINESKDDHDFYLKTNQIAHDIDPTRQTCGIRNIKHGDFIEDIYSYNDFSHDGITPGLEHPKKVVRGYVPYLVTEHNGHMYPTKKNDHSERHIEQAMRHTNVIEAAFSTPRISGAIGWCLADYQTHMQFGSNDRICHHGVMDSFRIPKPAAYAYQVLNKKHPVLEVVSPMIAGDYPGFKLPETVVFSNCDYLKVYKNDEYIATYYSEWQNYPNHPYPPFIFDDLIGDLLETKEDFSPRDAKRLKRLFIAFSRYGFKLPLKDKLTAFMLLRRKVIDMPKLMSLFEKYIAFQGATPTVFRFEGYIDDQLVITKHRGHTKKAALFATLDHDELVHDQSYDVTRVVIRMVDEYQHDLPFATDSVTIKTSKELELIGPSTLSLIAGSAACYVKTNGLVGKASITIESERFDTIVLHLDIKKGTSDLL